MCELLCLSREYFGLKEFEKESSFVKIKMDFEKTLFLWLYRFDSNNIKYALIGGFAQGLYGILRTTFDIDFIVDYDKEKLKKIFSDFYKVFYESKWVLQFVSENKLYSGIKVARIEDIIGLKLQAIKNDPKRYVKERFDIESIMEINGKKLEKT